MGEPEMVGNDERGGGEGLRRERWQLGFHEPEEQSRGEREGGCGSGRVLGRPDRHVDNPGEGG